MRPLLAQLIGMGVDCESGNVVWIRKGCRIGLGSYGRYQTDRLPQAPGVSDHGIPCLIIRVVLG